VPRQEERQVPEQALAQAAEVEEVEEVAAEAVRGSPQALPLAQLHCCDHGLPKSTTRWQSR